MALLPLPQGMPSFDARQVEPAKLFEPVPAGWYNVKIIKSENKPTAKGGTYLELELEIIDGDFANRKVWERLNLVNANDLAVKIAYQQLAAICNATGVVVLNDSSQLHGIPIKAKFKVTGARTGADGQAYEPSNEVSQGGYESLQAAATSATPPAWAPPPTTSTPPAPGWSPPATTPPPWEKKPTEVTPPPVVTAAPTPAAYPPEAVAWAIANPTDPQAAPILAQLPRAPATPPPATAPATPPWATKPAVSPPSNGQAQAKPPWMK